MIRSAVTLLLLLTLAGGSAAANNACPAEVQRAKRSLSDIYRQWPLRATGDPVAGAVQSIARELAERSGNSGSRRWRIHVVRDSKLNAFSVGDGHIFVTEGMLRFVNNEAELAAVLAHEFGHHLAGHFCKRGRKKGFFSGVFGGPQESRTDRRQVGSLTALVDPEMEQEADRVAVILLRRAGYDPLAALRLANRMAAVNGSSAHFQYGHRIEALQSVLAGRPPRAPVSPRPDSTAFEAMREALLLQQSAGP